ncbi:hypothetical protein E2320_007294 [Naja naja]|nr:hypothetical protein E2320_007294 [Naja naja]
MASLDLPYRCPRCGEHKRFRSLSSLRAHLEYNHTYETLYVLSKTNSICDATIFPLLTDATLLSPATRRDIFESTSFQGKEQHLTCDLLAADELESSSSTASSRYFHEIEIPLTEIFTRKAMTSSATPPAATATSAAATVAAVDAAYEEGLTRLKIRAFEKLEVDKRLEKFTEEVEQKIASQVGRLQVELDRKTTELEKAKQESLKLSREKQELEDRAVELSRQVDVSVEMLASLKQDLVLKEQELTRKQQFFSLLKQSCETKLTVVLLSLGSDKRDKHSMADTTPHSSYAVSNQRSSSSTGSGCYDSDSPEAYQGGENSNGPSYQSRGSESGFDRPGGVRSSALRRQAIQNWHRRPYRNSTEGEEGDISDIGSRTTESEAEMWELEPRVPAEVQQRFLVDRGCLEAGLESLLKASGSNLLILRVSHCPNILTDRSLWLASCYCRALQAVTYRQQPTRFSNRCLQMIGRCWPHLRALGVGGAGCGLQGLASLARNCMRLQVLELDHVTEVNQEVAAEVCREGLKGLEMLVLTSTPVTPKALLHFNSE